MYSVARLRALFDVDTNGLLIRKVAAGKYKAGTIAGSLDKTRGYVQVRVDGVLLYAHRVVYAVVTGEVPQEVDHKDTNKSNNKPSNLRAATRENNAQNRGVTARSASGVKGLYYNKTRKLWVGTVRRDGVLHKCESVARTKVEAWLLTTRAEVAGEFAHD